MSEFSIVVIHRPLLGRQERPGQARHGTREDVGPFSWPRFDGEAMIVSATIKVHRGQFDATSTAWRDAAQLIDSLPEGLDAGELECVESTARTMAGSADGTTATLTDYACAVLCNGLGRYGEARAAAESACDPHDVEILVLSLTELVEAGARSGTPDVAADALERLEQEWAAAIAAQWVAGLQARSRALLAAGADAESHYRDALEFLTGCRVGFQLARAHLLYGEWLRREGRRVDARVQLRTAHEMFVEDGLRGFAERARRELAATGETARKRSVESRYDLTPQEAQIARLARDGRTNPEIGAELFISPRTVEWHLRKVFAKLCVSSRRQLRVALPDLGHTALSA